MSGPSFNLATDPWLPVIDDKRRRSTRSLIGLFADAAHLTRLDFTDPLERTAAYRLLFAIGQAAGEQNPVAYLKETRGRFDLFDTEHPFLQTPGMTPINPKRAVNPGLELHPMMFRPYWSPLPTNARIEPARIAPMLLACMNYDRSGLHSAMKGEPKVMQQNRVSLKGPAQAGQLMHCVILGPTIADTIRMNTTQENTDDRPAWEYDLAIGDAITPTGSTLAFTWPSRRILLLHDADGLTYGAYVTRGTDRDEEREHNPTAFWSTEKDTPAGSTATLDKPVWTNWKHYMAPDNRPLTFDTLDTDKDTVFSIEIVNAQYGTMKATFSGVRDDTYTIRRDRLDRYEEACVHADKLAKHAWPRYRRTNDPHAYDQEDRLMRAWLAGGPAPDLT